ncbi:hypothetical protein [Limobrevibacterium gyesilva]|uniref:Uncharacterized protein n=1 Tax=Limobrevibacterium gyesilva TaxID=2991712 RepID=A0AA41YMX8_9PROT|nr:hypothetical protein [Limobrevibacterium gyesilva]MCW3475297.1 hypothetical protein [Limobrevibacterium gyesilva]
MALAPQPVLRPADDRYARYYAEKLWDWIPEIYRTEDGQAQNPGVLRAIVELIAEQAAIARRSVDRLWEDAEIDTADDWAVPYIGDLVATRLISALNLQGRRADVAKTIFYRRRAGTPLVLETLTRDIGRWDAAVVEAFKRLARTRHGLDPEPDPLRGPVTLTPPGGLADLRAARASELVDGAFDEFAHTADFRRLAGLLGRLNIPKVNVHVFRQSAFRVTHATALDLGAERFVIDPSGRDVPLFRPGLRGDPLAWRPAREWEEMAPIPCRLLNAANYLLTQDGVPAGLEPQLAPLVAQLVRGAARLRATVAALLGAPPLPDIMAEIFANSITADSPKRNLIPDAVALTIGTNSGAAPLGPDRIVAGDLGRWGTGLAPPPEALLLVDPVRGRILLTAPPGPGEALFVAATHYGGFGAVGAGTYDRRAGLATANVTVFNPGPQDGNGNDLAPGPVTGFALPLDGVHEFADSKTYVPDAPPGNVLGPVNVLTLQAADRTRPYIRLVPDAGATSLTIAGPAVPTPPRALTVDGLWIGILPSGLADQPLPTEDSLCVPVETVLVIDGVFDRVTISRATLDPGGERARLDPLIGRPIPYVALEVRGQVGELVIEGAILGPIHEATAAGDPCSIGRLVISDSIVQSLTGEPAIATRVAAVSLARTTVFGDVHVDRLDATDSLIQGVVRVVDNQHGCFRFSAAADAPDARLPQQYESQLFPDGVPNHWFVSRRFGAPGYAQLSETCPATVCRGGENGAEMGVFNQVLDAIRRDDVRTKLDEFAPISVIADLVIET